jgi:hypothetical protein
MRAALPAATRRWVQRPDWLLAFLASAILLGALAALQASLGELRAGSPSGIAYGVAGTLLMLAATLLGVRRRTMRWSFGRTQDWVQLHVYGGTMFLPLVLLHTGFHWPRETLTTWLLGLSIWVATSGVLGVVLRKWIPRLLSSGLSIEVLYERIPELSLELAERAREVAKAASPAVRDTYRRHVAPLLGVPRFRPIFFLDITGGIARRVRVFELLRSRLSADELARLDRLEGLVRSQLELDAHWTLQRPLRLWLLAHVPVSLVLIALVGAHIFSVLYY